MLKTIGLVLLSFSLISTAHAMGSTNFSINWDSVNSGGDDISSSTNYRIRDTVGDQAVGSSTSASYSLQAGYRQGDIETTLLSFEIGTQENGTAVGYTAFDDAGKNVTVTSTSGYLIGDFIGVVEDLGLTELVAIGKITSIGGNTLFVDSWEGDSANMGPSPLAGNSFVFRLNGSGADLETLSPISGHTSLTRTSVISNADNGYTVYVSSDGGLRSSSSTDMIDNVSDGVVTIGSEEYGAAVTGTRAVGTGLDFPFSTTTRAIQTNSGISYEDRIGLIYKASIAPATPEGVYSQHVFFTVTANL